MVFVWRREVFTGTGRKCILLSKSLYVFTFGDLIDGICFWLFSGQCAVRTEGGQVQRRPQEDLYVSAVHYGINSSKAG
jgi:hypothetical protein